MYQDFIPTSRSFLFSLVLSSLPSLCLFAKDVNSWGDLKAHQGDTAITLSEDSTLNLTLSQTNQAFSDNLNLTLFSLVVNVDIQGTTGSKQTTIYQNTSPTSLSIAGMGLLILNIKGNQNINAKSLFNAERGEISIASPMEVRNSQNHQIFSVFRSAIGGKIAFLDNLKVDLGNASGALKHNGDYYKAIFDIVDGTVEINQSSDKKNFLKGDIYSNSGVFKANFTDRNSKIEGKLAFRGDEIINQQPIKPFETLLNFDHFASGKMTIKTQGKGTLNITAKDQASISGSIDTQNVGNIPNTTELTLNFDNASYTSITWLGGSSLLKANFSNSSSWNAPLTLKALTNKPTAPTYTLNFTNSSFNGTITAEGNNYLKAVFESSSINTTLNTTNSTLDFTLNNLPATRTPSVINLSGSNTTFTLDSINSTYSLALTLNGASTSTITHSQVNHTGKIALSDTSALNLIAKASTYNSDIILNGNATYNATYSGSNITSNIKLSDSASLTLALNNSSRLEGTLNLIGASPTLNLNANNSTIAFSQTSIGGVGSSSITLDNSSQWFGELEINFPSFLNNGIFPHTITLTNNSTFKGNFIFKNSANVAINSTQSKIEGNMTISNEANTQAILNSSTLTGDVKLQNLVTFSLIAQNKSTIRSLVNISELTTEAKLDFRNSQFYGAILQDVAPNKPIGTLIFNNASTWYITQSSILNTLTLGSNDTVDFTKQINGSERVLQAINDSNRIVLDTQRISGSGLSNSMAH